MKKVFNLLVKVMIVMLVMVCTIVEVCAINTSGDHSYLERSEDGIKVNGATYRKVERLDEKDLSFGVKYYNDSMMVSTTLPERMTEYALGGSSYGEVPFVMNQEYSGKAFVVEIPVTTGVEVVPWQVVTNGVWQLAAVKQIAEDFEKHYPEYKVLAAINGSFFDINATSNYSHTSSGDISCFGENYKMTNCNHQLGFANNGSVKSIVEQTTLDKSATPFIDIYDAFDNIIYSKAIDKINEEPGESEITVFYGLYDSAHHCQSIDVQDCYIIDGKDTYSVAYSSKVFYGKGVITNKGNATLKQNQFAIKSNNEELNAKLNVGTKIRVQYQSELVNEVGNTIYYVDKLVDNGEIQDEVKDEGVLSSYSQYRYPRTLLGKKADGTIVMTVTDGRQASKGLYGMNGSESAAEMMYYGCDEAWCFDGGGSTSMCILVDGELQYVNSPSDGSQRLDGNGMLVVVKVPTVEISNTSTQNSITFNVNVTKEVEQYKDLYIGIGETKKKVNNEAITFDGLDTYNDYVYRLYAKVGDDYLNLPYAGTVNTAKHEIVFDKLTVKVEGDNYKVFYDLTDTDNAINTIALVIGGKRITAKNGVITVKKEEYSDLLSSNCKFVIAYDLDDLGGKKHAQTAEYECKAVVIDPEIALTSIIGEIEALIGHFYE